jgi:hypothetical protein
MGTSMSDAEISSKMRDLVDRAEIYDCMMRYARGMDRRDRGVLRSAYRDGAIDDHVDFIGEVDDFIDWAFAYHGTKPAIGTTCSTTPSTSRETPHLRRRTTCSSARTEPANHVTISGGRYVDRLERRDGRWAIVARVCVVEWITESTSSITEEVIGMLSAVQVPTKDRSDPSYARPLVVSIR